MRHEVGEDGNSRIATLEALGVGLTPGEDEDGPSTHDLPSNKPAAEVDWHRFLAAVLAAQFG